MHLTPLKPLNPPTPLKLLDQTGLRPEDTARTKKIEADVRALQMPYEVVISHSIDGKSTANAVCKELESVGIRCWILPRDLKIGVPLDQCISKAVASCRIMIVLLVLGVGFWRTKNDLNSGLPKPKRAMTTPAGKETADRGEIEYVVR